jgi:acetoin utilization deacetylase AcuC-like enzyme
MTFKTFYREEQNARTKSPSPSPFKPAKVVEDWILLDYIKIADIESFEPATRADLYKAHTKDYVDGVLDMRYRNGFGNQDLSVAMSLPFTSGSMLAAATYAARTKSPAFSPTSGFHHAGHSFGGGFCTFNGLMVAALSLKERGLVDTVGILDCDYHYGNGTDDIINKLDIDWIVHRTMAGCNGVEFRRWLDRSIEDIRGCDLVIYQAGVDCHVDDPYGGSLTDKGIAMRDCQVVSEFGNKAFVWNLAGGYQFDDDDTIEPTLAMHRYMGRWMNKLED